MGKDLQGNELGRGISQRKEDGLYTARVCINKHRYCIYDNNLEKLKEKFFNLRDFAHDRNKKKKEEVFENITQKAIKENKGGYVYFITDGQYVKIGTTNDLDRRLKFLQTGNPRELSILYSVFCSNPFQTETMYHKLFKNKHIFNEWYDIKDTICGLVK